MTALAVLILTALACLAGPQLTGHDPDRAYPDLRQLPAGLTAQPDAAHLGPALERLAFRMRVRLDAVAREGDTMRLTLASDAGVDRRSLVYLPRSGLFGPPTVLEARDGGHNLVMSIAFRAKSISLWPRMPFRMSRPSSDSSATLPDSSRDISAEI